MVKEEKSKEVLEAEEGVRKARAKLERVKAEEKKKQKKAQDHHKIVMGGIVAKYFPDCYDFSEQEMNRIIACAFKSRDVLNMVAVVVRERNAGNGNSVEKVDSQSNE